MKLIILLLLFALAACTGSDADIENKETAAQETNSEQETDLLNWNNTNWGEKWQ